MDDFLKTKTGMIKTGEGTSVNPAFLSEAGRQQAQQYAKQSAAITSASLTPATPYKLPEIPTSTAAEGLTGYVDGLKTNLVTDKVAEQERTARTAKDISKQDFQDTLNKVLGITEERGNLEQEAGLGVKRQLVTDFTNKIEASQRAQTNELRALDGSGLTDVQRAAQAREITRKYAFEQADLGISQSAANRDYETASNIINRKVDLMLETLKIKLDYQKTFYQDYREDLTKAEDRQLTNLINESERQHTEKQQTLKTISDYYNTAAQNGAPQNVLNSILQAQNRGDLVEAQRLAGGYMVDPLERQLKQAQIAKSKEPKATSVIEKDTKSLTINQIEQFRRSYGWTPPLGYTMSQLNQYIKDNPNATPEELEAGARGVVDEKINETDTGDAEQVIRDSLSVSELKKLSDWAGTSKWWRTKSADINAFFKQADGDQLNKIRIAIEAGYSIEEIIKFLG